MTVFQWFGAWYIPSSAVCSNMGDSTGCTAGRLVTVCLARNSGNVESLLRVDAKPFIAAHLKTVFSFRPQQFHSVQLQLAELFSERYSAVPLAAGQVHAVTYSA